MPEPIGVAVIGTGGIAEAHTFAYQREEARCRVVAVVDVDRDRAQKAADRVGAEVVLEDYREALTRGDIHAVSVCTPPFLHVEISSAALRAGKHVLCEKPVAPTLAGLDEIAAAASESGAIFSGVFQLRFGRGARQVRAALDDDRFGQIHLGIAETLWRRDDAYYDQVSWRGTWEQEAGGVTVSQAIHLIDALVWFMGEPVSVHAAAGTFAHDIEVDDASVAVVRFAGGGIGQITCSVNAFGEERSRLELYGRDLSAVSTGSAYDSTAEPFVFASRDPSVAVDLEHELDERYPSGYRILHRGSVADFLQAIEEKSKPLVGIDECRTALQVTAGIYKSAMTGQPVALPIAADDPFYSELPPAGFAFA